MLTNAYYIATQCHVFRVNISPLILMCIFCSPTLLIKPVASMAKYTLINSLEEHRYNPKCSRTYLISLAICGGEMNQ